MNLDQAAYLAAQENTPALMDSSMTYKRVQIFSILEPRE